MAQNTKMHQQESVGVNPVETTSSPDVAGMLKNSEELDRLRGVQQEVLCKINIMHDMICSAPPDVLQRHGDNMLTRLKMLYTQAKELAESEVNVSDQLVGQLDTFMLSGAPSVVEHGFKEPNEPRRRQMKADSDISMHSPSVENHPDTVSSLTGEQVAARVTEGGEKDQWVVAKVIHSDRESGEVEVLDEEPGDDEKGGSQRKYKLPVSDIIPFPKRIDISGA